LLTYYPRGGRGKYVSPLVTTVRGTSHPRGNTSGIDGATVEAEVLTEALYNQDIHPALINTNVVGALPNANVGRQSKHTWVMMAITPHQSSTWVKTLTAAASAVNLVASYVQNSMYASAVDVVMMNATVIKCKTSDNTLALLIPPGGLNHLIEIHTPLLSQNR
jgi:hypothetical protein